MSELVSTLLGAGIFIWILLVLFIILLPLIAMWKVFTKAGQPGIAAIIPIFNIVVLLKVAGKPVWWILLFLIPIVNLVFYIMMLNGIAKRFGKDEIYTIGLFFFPFIFWLILGFGSATYTKPLGNN